MENTPEFSLNSSGYQLVYENRFTEDVDVVDLEFIYIKNLSEYRFLIASTPAKNRLWDSIDYSPTSMQGVRKAVFNTPIKGKVYISYWRRNNTYFITTAREEKLDFSEFTRLLFEKYPPT